MRLKKIFSSLIALSMTMSIASTTVLAETEDNVVDPYVFHYTDMTGLPGYEVETAPMVLDKYEPNDLSNLRSLGYIESAAVGYPITTIQASLDIDEDMYDGYTFYTATGSHSGYVVKDVEEVVIYLGGFYTNDRVTLIITQNGETVVSGIIDGSQGSALYLTIPTVYSKNDRFNIYLGNNIEGYNPIVNYTLQIASRYVTVTTESFDTYPTVVRNSGNDYYSTSTSLKLTEKQVPKSAMLDGIFAKGTLLDDRTGGHVSCSLKIKKDNQEIYGTQAFEHIERLTNRNLSLIGTWDVSFKPFWDVPCTLYNMALSFDYTYDILVG